MLRSFTGLPSSVVSTYASVSVTSSSPCTDESVGGSTNVSSGTGTEEVPLPQPGRPGGTTSPAPSVQPSRRKSRRSNFAGPSGHRGSCRLIERAGADALPAVRAADLSDGVVAPADESARRQRSGVRLAGRDRVRVLAGPARASRRGDRRRRPVRAGRDRSSPTRRPARYRPSASEKCIPAATFRTRSGSATATGTMRVREIVAPELTAMIAAPGQHHAVRVVTARACVAPAAMDRIAPGSDSGAGCRRFSGDPVRAAPRHCCPKRRAARPASMRA